MVATKGGGGSGAATTTASLTNLIQPTRAECCMCGDYGLSEELFRCKICKIRFQHKYCSNQYPKAELYKACNWCLTQKHDSGNSSNSSAACRNNSGDGRRNIHTGNNKRIGQRSLRERRKGSEIRLTSSGVMKKVNGLSPEEESPVSTGRKKMESHGMLRKSKSANHISNGGGTKTRPVFRLPAMQQGAFTTCILVITATSAFHLSFLHASSLLFFTPTHPFHMQPLSSTSLFLF